MAGTHGLAQGNGRTGKPEFSQMVTPLKTCLDRALDGLTLVPASWVETGAALGLVLAEDLCLPDDLPPASEALRAGFAVAALDLVGASAGSPVPLVDPVWVVPGDAVNSGMDAVLPEDGTETEAGWCQAVRPVSPGDGVRRAGHDARAGDLIARAGTRLVARHLLIAAQAGTARIAVRRPRVAIALHNPDQTAFVRGWFAALGACVVDGKADLTLRPVTDHAPRLALTPAETAWMAQTDEGLVMTVPLRFDAMIAALLGQALPALVRLSGATPLSRTLPLARKLTSTVGLSELVLLAEDAGHWLPQPAGLLTLSGLAATTAFSILPPDSEGLPAGAPLVATPFDLPFG
jgi:molybdopterin biosynthesis enzyme